MPTEPRRSSELVSVPRRRQALPWCARTEIQIQETPPAKQTLMQVYRKRTVRGDQSAMEHGLSMQYNHARLQHFDVLVTWTSLQSTRRLVQCTTYLASNNSCNRSNIGGDFRVPTPLLDSAPTAIACWTCCSCTSSCTTSPHITRLLYNSPETTIPQPNVKENS